MSSTANPDPNDTSMPVEAYRHGWLFQPCLRSGFCCRRALCSLAYHHGGDRILKQLEADPKMVCPYLTGDEAGEHSCQILDEDPSLGQYVGLGGGCCSSMFNDDRLQAAQRWGRKYMTLRDLLNKHLWGDGNLAELTVTIRHRGAPNDERVIAGADVTEIGKFGIGMGEEPVEFCEVTEDPDFIPFHRFLKVEDADGKTLWEKPS